MGVGGVADACRPFTDGDSDTCVSIYMYVSPFSPAAVPAAPLLSTIALVTTANSYHNNTVAMGYQLPWPPRNSGRQRQINLRI